MCSRLPPHAANLLLWLQQWSHPLLQPGGCRGPGGAQVGTLLVPGPIDAHGGSLWVPWDVWVPG